MIAWVRIKELDSVRDVPLGPGEKINILACFWFRLMELSSGYKEGLWPHKLAVIFIPLIHRKTVSSVIAMSKLINYAQTKLVSSR